MSNVVFLRAVNVGGHQAFKPSLLAKKLADLDVVSIGAAGTFVVRKKIGQAALRAAISRHLPFEAEIMISDCREVIEIARGKDFEDDAEGGDVRRFVTILAKRLRKLPVLPFAKPAGDEWQVKVLALRGKFALSYWRRMGRNLIYPNEVVEKLLGTPATTRNWNTIMAICAILTENKK